MVLPLSPDWSSGTGTEAEALLLMRLSLRAPQDGLLNNLLLNSRMISEGALVLHNHRCKEVLPRSEKVRLVRGC